ncbi:MAG: DUF6261 family protein [Mediterranea sp.]|nr:DUF6261 family protein [Mediterranea sp.]
MIKKLIRFFKFHELKLVEFFDATLLIVGNIFTVAIAQSLGLDKVYGEVNVLFDKLVEIFRRNPAMFQTEELTETVAGIRRKMILLKNMLKDTVASAKGDDLQKAKLLEYTAHPYLKNAAHDTQSAIAANGIELSAALRTSANLPALTTFGLKAVVDDIATMATKANSILLLRGEEEEFRKQVGSANAVRKELEKKLRFLLYSSIPAHYAEATGAQITEFEHLANEINGALNSFRHLTSSTGDTTGGSGYPEEPDDNDDNEPGGSEPDTQPADPPSGGGFTDPDA